jgi:hypothetical protein
MVPMIERAVRSYRVEVASSSGFDSVTVKHDLFTDALERYESFGQRTVLLHLGDHELRKLFPKYKRNWAHVLRYDSWYHKRGALRASRIGQSLEKGGAARAKVLAIAGAPAFLLTSVGGWVSSGNGERRGPAFLVGYN